MKIERRPSASLLPVPLVLVTAADGSRTDIVTLAWVGIVNSEPPMVSVSIRPSRLSHELVIRTREFVINVPRASQALALDRCGMVSGREVDKFKAFGFTAQPAAKVGAPLLAECPINLECVVRHVMSLGTHDLFISEVVATHFDADILDVRGHVKHESLEAFGYVEGEYWSLGEKIGSYGFSKHAAEQNEG